MCLEHRSVHSTLFPLPRGVARGGQARAHTATVSRVGPGQSGVGGRCCRGNGNCVQERGSEARLGVRKTAGLSEGQCRPLAASCRAPELQEQALGINRKA